MDAGLKGLKLRGAAARTVAASLLFVGTGAWADSIYRCKTSAGHTSIQSEPCDLNSKLVKVYRDTEPKPERRAARRAPAGEGNAAPPAVASTKGNGGGVPVGLRNQRNKDVICGLLAAEKRDAQAQIAGTLAAPPGENAADNLAKIEKQRTRVACES